MTTNIVHLGLGWIGDRGGGLERYQHGLCEAQSKLGLAVEALVQSRVPIASPAAYSITAYASPDESRRVKLEKLKRTLAPLLRRQNLIFASHHASVSGAVCRYLSDVPHVVHFHGPWADEAAVEGAAWWKTCLQRREELKAYRSAGRIITLSRYFAEVLITRYRIDPAIVRIVPGGIDAVKNDPGITRREARDALGWPQDRPIVLSIRRLVKRVGVDVLVDAAKLIVARHPELLILIGGTGPLSKELQSKIDAYDLRNQVRLLGYIPDDLLSTAYRAADLSVVPTQELEGFGLVTLESMAAGTPPIVTPVGALPEIVEPLSKELVFQGRDASAIANGLVTILDGTTKLPDDNAFRDYVRRVFDWQVIAPRVAGVYRELSAD